MQLPDLKFNNIILKRVTELKFLDVMIDKNLNRQSHIKLVESKISKNIGVLFKGTLHLNVYQITILKILTFMQKVKYTTITRVFLSTFEETEHKYPTRFSKYNFKQPTAFINYAKSSIFSRRPKLWNVLLSETEKSFPNLLIF